MSGSGHPLFRESAETIRTHFGRIFQPALLKSFGEYVLALYDQADMAIIALSASQAPRFSSSYAVRLENNSFRQVRTGGVEWPMTEQRVEFVIVNFAHRVLTR